MLLNVSFSVAVFAVVEISVNFYYGDQFRWVVGEFKYVNIIHGPSFRRSVLDGHSVVIEIAKRVVASQEFDLGAWQDVLENKVGECVLIKS